MDASPVPKKRFTGICLTAIILGVVLRLLWPGDMEWKYDERWMTEKANAIRTGSSALPWLGMPSGAKGLVNPGFSVWPFAALARVNPTPIGLVSGVMVLNSLALFALFAAAMFLAHQRNKGFELFLWALALMALSPMAILYSRKIWAQDLLPVFIAAMTWGWLGRKHFWGSLLFVLTVGLSGQLHMSGIFLGAALAVAVTVKVVFELKEKKTLAIHPFGVIAGLSLAIPGWFFWTTGLGSQGHGGFHGWEYVRNIFSFKWITHGTGYFSAISLKESLGGNFSEFLVFRMGGRVTAIPAILMGAVALLLLIGHGMRFGEMAKWVQSFKAMAFAEKIRILLENPFFVVVVLTGILVTATGINIQPHYLIITTPFLFLWPAWVLRNTTWRLLFLGLNGALSLCFLLYIHGHGGAPKGDYGVTYQEQIRIEASQGKGTNGVFVPAKTPR